MKSFFLAVLSFGVSLNALAIDKAEAQKQLEQRLQDFSQVYFVNPWSVPSDPTFTKIRNTHLANFYIHRVSPTDEKKFAQVGKVLEDAKLRINTRKFCEPGDNIEVVIDSLQLRWSENLNYGNARVRWGVKCGGQTSPALSDEERWVKYSDYKWAISLRKPQIMNAVEFVNLVYVDKNFEEALKLVGGTQRWSRAVKEKNIALLKESEEAHRAHALENHQCESFDVALLGKGSNIPESNNTWADVVVALVGCKNAAYEFKLRANGKSLDWDQILKMLPVSE